MTNPFEFEGAIVRIYLRSKGKIIGHTIIDATDFDLVSKWSWRLSNRGYAIHNGRNVGVTLHQHLLGKRAGLVIDHKNNDQLDNRRLNLQHITQRANCLKSTQTRRSAPKGGVFYDAMFERWRGEVCFAGVRHRTQRFKTRDEALVARMALEQRIVPSHLQARRN